MLKSKTIIISFFPSCNLSILFILAKKLSLFERKLLWAQHAGLQTYILSSNFEWRVKIKCDQQKIKGVYKVPLEEGGGVSSLMGKIIKLWGKYGYGEEFIKEKMEQRSKIIFHIILRLLRRISSGEKGKGTEANQDFLKMDVEEYQVVGNVIHPYKISKNWLFTMFWCILHVVVQPGPPAEEGSFKIHRDESFLFLNRL